MRSGLYLKEDVHERASRDAGKWELSDSFFASVKGWRYGIGNVFLRESGSLIFFLPVSIWLTLTYTPFRNYRCPHSRHLPHRRPIFIILQCFHSLPRPLGNLLADAFSAQAVISRLPVLPCYQAELVRSSIFVFWGALFSSISISVKLSCLSSSKRSLTGV